LRRKRKSAGDESLLVNVLADLPEMYVPIIALDLATNTGWATSEPRQSGSEKFNLRRGESPGMRFLRFNAWLTDLCSIVSQKPCELENEKLAWAAGFYDGEGCTLNCLAYKKKHISKAGKESILSSDNISMQISQVGRESLDRFDAALGGVGTINGPYKDKRPNASPIHMWRTTGVKHVRDSILLLWPWLGTVKRKQAEKALCMKLSGMKRFSHIKSRGIIIYESAHHRGGHATACAYGFISVVERVAATYGFETMTVHTSTLKKFATGSGRANKNDMIAAAKAKGWNPQDDDEADAQHLLDYAVEELR